MNYILGQAYALFRSSCECLLGNLEEKNFKVFWFKVFIIPFLEFSVFPQKNVQIMKSVSMDVLKRSVIVGEGGG